MLPVILMAVVTIIQMTHAKSAADSGLFYNVILFLGNSTIAMLISLLFAIYTMGLGRGKTIPDLMDSCGKAIAGIAGLLLIIGGGGAFKQVLIDSGVGQYISTPVSGMDINPILMAGAWPHSCVFVWVQPPSRRSLPPVWSSHCWQYIPIPTWP